MSVGQRFTVGYHLNTWDLGGLPLADGLRAIRQAGFRYVEALARDGFSNDFARRYMGTGDQPIPRETTDIEFLARIEHFSNAAADGLSLSSLYCNREYVNPLTWAAERATLDATLRVLKGFGAPGVVLGGGPPARGEDHSPERYRRFAQAIIEVSDRAAALGMWAAYHPHIDTFIETREQLDRLMTELEGTSATLCIDIAHLTLTGGDPVAALRDYRDRLRHVHLKDVLDPSEVVGVDRYEAFRPLGDGAVDIRGSIAQLIADGYDGIALIELDTTEGDPIDAMNRSIDYLAGLGVSLEPTLTPEETQ